MKESEIERNAMWLILFISAHQRSYTSKTDALNVS